MLGNAVEPDFEDGAELDPSGASACPHRPGDEVVELPAVVHAELHPQDGEDGEVDEVGEREVRAREDPVLDLLADTSLVEAREGSDLVGGEDLGGGH